MRRMNRSRTYGGEVTLPTGASIIVSAPFSGTLQSPGKGSVPNVGTAVKFGQPVFQLLPLLSPEREVLTPADEENHIDKRPFRVPFVCGAKNLGEALRRISEGAAMIRTKGEAGSGNIVEAVRHMRTIQREMKQLTVLSHDELYAEAPTPE